MQTNKVLWSCGAVLCGWLMQGAMAIAADWPMRGRDNTRNGVSPERDAPLDWKLPEFNRFDDGIREPGRGLRWTAEVGFPSCGDPVISGGLVWVGTTQGYLEDGPPRPDASVLMCFSECDGEFLYQYTSLRHGNRDVDWPPTSLASSPLIEGDRLWFCNNRCEVICLDIAPLLARKGDPRVVWKLDMRSEFGVVPRGVMIGSHSSHCSIAGYKDLIYVNTTNSRSPYDVVAAEAPSLLCLEKGTGAARWQDNSPGKNIFHVQHGSPLVVEVEGKPQTIMGQGDGWVRGFDALTGEVLWKFDINRKGAVGIYGKGGNSKSFVVAMPVYCEGLVYFAVGRESEGTFGQGRLCCIDPTKRGDISSELDDGAGQGIANPHSGLVWEYAGGEQDAEQMHRTLASPVIHRGLLIAADSEGIIHCLDARTGEGFWTHATNSAIMGSPLIVGDVVYAANEEDVFLFDVAREKKLLACLPSTNTVEAGMAFANRTLYLLTRSHLHAIGQP